MQIRRRKAHFVANLIIIDEPQLFALKAGKSPVVGVAIDSSVLNGYDYIAATVTERNWHRYLDGFVDLQYLFTYPFQRRLFKFRHSDWNGDEIMMTPHDGGFSAAVLPSKGLFSRDHTEDFYVSERPDGQEKLFIDGEWELDEFGKFYQKYSDIYALTTVLSNADDPSVKQVYKGKAVNALMNKPYKGGSSYLHVFDELNSCIPRSQKLGLDGIVYNSPGDVRIWGDESKLSRVEVLVSHFVANRDHVRDSHKELREYLSDRKMLTLSAAAYGVDNPEDGSIEARSSSLATAMSLGEFDTLKRLCGHNNLVAAKVLLALFRRVETAAAFFAEGRMAFERLV